MYQEFIYRPLFNLTVAIYNTLPVADLGLAIITMTVIIRLALSPLSRRALVLQRKMSLLTPRMNEIREKFKSDQRAQSEALTQLYKQEGINPLWGCVPLLIQIPIIFALYRVFSAVSKGGDLNLLYSFISNPIHISATFLHIVDLSQPSHVLAILAGALQFMQARQTIQKPQGPSTGGIAEAMNTQMLYFFPAMIIIISWRFPAGLSLYWVTTTAFSIVEQLYIRKTMK